MAHIRFGRKALLGIAAVLAVVVVAATPAGAAAGALEGVLDVGGFSLSVPDDAVGACDPVPADAVYDMTAAGTNASGTWGATTPTKISGLLDILIPGNTYRVNVSLLAATGTYTTTTPPSGYTHALASSGPTHLFVQLRFYRVTPPDCDKEDLRCTMNARVVLQNGSGFDGTLPGIDPGESAKLVISSAGGGTNLTPNGVCSADVSSLSNRPLSGELLVEF